MSDIEVVCSAFSTNASTANGLFVVLIIIIICAAFRGVAFAQYVTAVCVAWFFFASLIVGIEKTFSSEEEVTTQIRSASTICNSIQSPD